MFFIVFTFGSTGSSGCIFNEFEFEGGLDLVLERSVFRVLLFAC